MAAPSETYVDPSIAANSGSGTVGDPYGDLQFALDSVTRDATNGDRFNIKAGTDEVLAAAISLATYGTPAASAPLIFQGYTSAAADGGIGGISGGGSVSIFDSTTFDWIVFQDLHLHNCGAAKIVRVDDHCAVINCEIDNTSGDGVDGDDGFQVIGCHLHNIGGVGARVEATGYEVSFCYFKNDGANSMTTCIESTNASSHGLCTHNVISASGTTGGISLPVLGAKIHHNSVYTTGSGTGISIPYAHAGRGGILANNLVEGWTTGIDASGVTSSETFPIVGNAGFDNGTDFNLTADVLQTADNESLAATPFAKTGSDTYANRAAYFAPVDTGNVYSAYGGMGTKGAVSLTSSGGGGGGGGGPLIGGRLVR